jgi:hypothetical protein
MSALVPFEEFVFVDKFPTYIDLFLERDHALGRNKSGHYTIRYRGWMLEDGIVRDEQMEFLRGLPRIDNEFRRKWAARWVDWYLITEAHTLGVRRLEFLRKHIASEAFRPFFTTKQAMEHIKKTPKDILLRLSTTYSGVLTLSYAVCDECPICLEFESVVMLLQCKHVVGSACWGRIAPTCPICRNSSSVTDATSNVCNENLEIDAKGSLVLMTTSLVYQLKFVPTRTFESPQRMQSAFLHRASSNQRVMPSVDVGIYT